MTTNQLQKKLLTFGIKRDGYFHVKEGKKIILYRQSIDQLESQINMSIRTTHLVCGHNFAGIIMGLFDETGSQVHEVNGEANPGNCEFNFFLAVAMKRARHKAILVALDLYQYGVHSIDESDEFYQLYMDKVEADSNSNLSELNKHLEDREAIISRSLG